MFPIYKLLSLSVFQITSLGIILHFLFPPKPPFTDTINYPTECYVTSTNPSLRLVYLFLYYIIIIYIKCLSRITITMYMVVYTIYSIQSIVLHNYNQGHIVLLSIEYMVELRDLKFE